MVGVSIVLVVLLIRWRMKANIGGGFNPKHVGDIQEV
jgi:hypothetical protein